VSKKGDILNKIIPFFNLHQIQGVKSSDLADFCKVAELVNNKAHLTLSGLEEIRKLKGQMNKKREDMASPPFTITNSEEINLSNVEQEEEEEEDTPQRRVEGGVFTQGNLYG
jgi:hypothetical protein